MKANELMIGDWFAFRGHPYKCTASDIASIAECEEKCAPTDISEIPLTPEILEKNFQEFLPGINLMYKLKGPYCVMNEDGQWVFGLVKVDGENSARYPLVKISFVHQLQHALRLCGIEKEITI
jgi:hypothetical protein